MLLHILDNMLVSKLKNKMLFNRSLVNQRKYKKNKTNKRDKQ